MADFGEIQRDQTGQAKILTLDGWKPISEQEVADRTQSAAMRFGEGLLFLDDRRTGGEAAALGSFLGEATLIGQAGRLGVGLIGKRVVKELAKKRAAREAAGEVTERAPALERTGTFQRDLGDVVRGPDPGAARKAAGAAADQLQAMVEATPLLRAVVRMPAAQRQGALNQLAVEGAGGTVADLTAGANLTRSSFGEVAKRVEQKFSSSIIDPKGRIGLESLAEEQALIKTLPKIEQTKFGRVANSKEISARELVEEFKRMQKIKISKQASDGEREVAFNIARKLENLAEQSKSIAADVWKQGREEFQFLLAMRKGAAFTKGQVNAGSYFGNLRRIFKKEFAEQRFDRLSPNGQRILETVAELEQMPARIGSSGTAERMGGLLGPFAFALGAGIF